MKKLCLLVLTTLLLVACSSQNKLTDFDEEILSLLDVEEYEFEMEGDDHLFWHLRDVKDDSMYFSGWLTENRTVQYGLLRVDSDEREEIMNFDPGEGDLESFIEIGEDLYYLEGTWEENTNEDEDIKPEDRLTDYTVKVLKNGKHEELLMIAGKDTVSIPKLFILKGEPFVLINQVQDDNAEITIYNLKTQQLIVKIEAVMSDATPFLYDHELKGLGNDKLVFSTIHENEEDMVSTIYTFDGKDIKEDKYKGISIFDTVLIQDRLLFTYKEQGDDLEGYYGKLGFINDHEDLVLTEIKSTNIRKLVDIKDGALINGGVDGSNEANQYLEIKGDTINIESVSFIKETYPILTSDNGFVTEVVKNKTIRVYKHYKVK